MLDLDRMSDDRRNNGVNQGEGDRESARRYNDHVREFVVYGDVDRAAHDAERAIEGPEAAELRAAEKRGKAPARMTRKEQVMAAARRLFAIGRDMLGDLAERILARRHTRADGTRP